MDQVSALKSDLTRLAPTVEKLSTPTLARQAQESKLLTAHLKAIRENSSTTLKSSTSIIPSTTPETTKTTSTSSSDAVVYELYYTPPPPPVLNHLTELESRLAHLESLTGSRTDSVDYHHHDFPNAGPLTETIENLRAKVSALLDPKTMETIARRARTAALDMDKIIETRKKLQTSPDLGTASVSLSTATTPDSSSALDPDTIASISYLTSTLKTIDPLIPMITPLIERLRTLKALHIQANTFSESLSGLTDGIQKCDMGIKEAKDFVAGAEESWKENHQIIIKNMETIEERINNILNRMEQLKV